MNLRNLRTKRKLKKELEREREQNAYNQKLISTLEAVNQTLNSDVEYHKHENRELRNRIAMLFDEPHSGFECVGVTEVLYE